MNGTQVGAQIRCPNCNPQDCPCLISEYSTRFSLSIDSTAKNESFILKVNGKRIARILIDDLGIKVNILRLETAKTIFGQHYDKVFCAAQNEIARLMRHVNDGGKVEDWKSLDESFISIERV
ncbi:MAG: hypothetical protein ACMV0I_05450 [Pseudomonas sp.]